MPFSTLIRRAAILGAAIALCTTTASAQSGSVSNALLSRAMDRYKSARSVDIEFTQLVSNPLTQHSMTSRGELLRQRPNLLAITFSSPASDRIVDDGDALWVYLPSSAPGQVLKLPASGDRGVLLDPVGQILSTPLSEYTVTSTGPETIDGHSTQGFTLVPHSAHALFTRATVWVDDAGVLRQLEATEPSGLVRRITVSRYRTNVALPRSAFRFTPPTDVRIVDQAGRAGG